MTEPTDDEAIDPGTGKKTSLSPTFFGEVMDRFAKTGERADESARKDTAVVVGVLQSELERKTRTIWVLTGLIVVIVLVVLGAKFGGSIVGIGEIDVVSAGGE